MSHSGIAIIFAAAGWSAGAQGQDASFQGLGDLPGGGFNSAAADVSADGSVVVGGALSANGFEAFRWTAVSGMVGLGDIPGGSFTSSADAVSADGNVVVGFGTNAAGDDEAFRWTPAGMVALGSFPDADPDGEARGASADGSVVVGFNNQVFAQDQAFRWAGGMTALPFLPDAFDSGADDVSADGSVIVGWAENSDNVPVPVRWLNGSIQTLGDLPGGDAEGEAWAVSANGFTAVGESSTSTGYRAFRWTPAGGMQALGILAGDLGSQANGVSGDGALIVGEYGTAAGPRAFIWTAADGMRNLQDVLENDYGLDLAGWILTRAFSVSDDGTTIVGVGSSPGGTQAWRAVVPRLAVVAPENDALVVGGESYRIRWRAPSSVTLVDLVLLPDTLGSAAITIDVGVPASDTAFVWVVSDSLFSRSARLVIRDFLDASVADTTEHFRIKPYHLTRLTQDSTRYDPFRPGRHGWSFGNTTAILFPPEWQALPQFNYNFGPDPFTQSEYDRDFPDPPINAQPSVFSDWPAYVRAYGTDDAYHLIIPFVEAYYRDAFTAAWGAFHGGTGHRGSCSGMAVSSLLAFGHRTAFGTRYPAVGPVERLISVGMSPGVRELANTLYSYWGGTVQRAHRAAVGSDTRTPRQTLADLKAMLLSESRSTDGYLYIASGAVGGGAHAIVPYGLRRDPSGPNRWRVLVYDPNWPGDSTRVVLLDSTANQWSYAGGLNWSGSTGMYVMDPVPTYLTETGFPGLVPLDAPPAEGPAALYVAAAPGADVRLSSGQGAVGYAAGAVFNTLPGAVPDVPPVGGPTPPVGYEVPPDSYALRMAAFPDSAAAAYFFASGAVYAYGRADADPSHTDRVTYDPAAGLGGGLAVSSTDAGVTKLVALRTVLTEPDLERTLDVGDLALNGADSASFAALDGAAGPRLRLQNRGEAKTYTLRLRQATGSEQARFRHLAVPLPAGATHVVRPNWTTLGSEPVEVDVDLDGDGAPDEVLVLENQPVASEPAVPPPAGAAGLVLHPPVPNPAWGPVTVRYELPAAGRTRLTVFDVLGREVAGLVEGDRPAGVHQEVLSAGVLAPGAYVARLETAHESRSQRFTVAR